jgi:FkbM family methyltransferase
MTLKRIINFIKARYAPRGAKISFSGCGEDVIAQSILSRLKIKKVSYIDIGAHDPVFGNNTYLFYKAGGKGVLVEPNPELYKKIRNSRPKDAVVNAGVGKIDDEADFYAFKRSTRNTFSKSDAENWEEISGERPQILRQKLISLDSLIEKYLGGTPPDFVSMDTEGFDEEILSGFSWRKRPKLFCIESVMPGNESGIKDRNSGVYSTMQNKGYILVAETTVNALFLDSDVA